MRGLQMLEERHAIRMAGSLPFLSALNDSVVTERTMGFDDVWDREGHVVPCHSCSTRRLATSCHVPTWEAGPEQAVIY